MKRILLAMVAVVGGLSAPAAEQSASDSIRNFLQVNTDFCTGGQPRPEAFAALKSNGVRSVLNLRTPGEYREPDERAAAEQAGLKYFNLPVVYTDPRGEQVTEFLRLSDDPANRPMFIHCTAAIRVGAFWLIRRVVRDGWTWDAAIAEARKVGLVNAPHLEEFAKRYVAAQTGSSPAPSPSLDYEFFKTRVQPIFVARRPGHARCVACHASGTPLRLQPLAPGSTTWSEEDSRRNFAAVRRLVVPGSVKSRLLVHPLAEEAGGDFYHNGGKHWSAQNDPEWQTLKAWVLGQTTK
jgi:uncharacterized protein (TIGR01244 family)